MFPSINQLNFRKNQHLAPIRDPEVRVFPPSRTHGSSWTATAASACKTKILLSFRGPDARISGLNLNYPARGDSSRPIHTLTYAAPLVAGSVSFRLYLMFPDLVQVGVYTSDANEFSSEMIHSHRRCRFSLSF